MGFGEKTVKEMKLSRWKWEPLTGKEWRRGDGTGKVPRKEIREIFRGGADKATNRKVLRNGPRRTAWVRGQKAAFR